MLLFNGLVKNILNTERDTLSACVFVFLEHSNFSLGISKTRLRDEGLAEGHDVNHKAERVHVSCQRSQRVFHASLLGQEVEE